MKVNQWLVHRWIILCVFCFSVVSWGAYASLPSRAACLDAGGVVLNGSFEQGTDSWRFYSDGTATFRTNAAGYDCTQAARIEIADPGKNTQLYQLRIALEPATPYRFSFAAYSSSGADLALYLHQHDAPYTSYGLSVDRVDLSTSWQSFTFDFVSDGFQSPVKDGRLRFWFPQHATAGTTYWLDAIRLEKVTGDGPSATATTPPTGEATATASSTSVQQAATVTPVATATATPNRPPTTGANPIVIENQKPGTTSWQLTRKASDGVGQIKGYASSTSVNKGDTIDFHISVDKAQNYMIEIYRMGWYQGKGGRLVTSIGPLQGMRQPQPIADHNTGLLYCPWSVSYTLRIPQDWTTGIYVAKLTNANNYQNYILFVVRDDNRPADILYQQTVMTYQAYNDYPHDGKTGKSFYEGPSKGDVTLAGGQRAVMVSFDRPYSRDGAGKFFNWEYYFIRWIEQQGYDVAYSTSLDLHTNGERLLNYRAFVSAGHDEYWTYAMFDAAEYARDHGVNLAFFTGNTIYWQVRMDPSASGVPNRTMIGYKNVARLDPIADRRLATDKWRNVGRPEQALLSVMYPQGGMGNNTAYRVSNGNHWAYAGTGLQNGDKVAAVVGYEIDSYHNTVLLPSYKTLTVLASSPFYGSKGRTFSADTTLYTTANNTSVFAGATVSWGWGLDKSGFIDPRFQKLTANILDRFTGNVAAAAHQTALVRPDELLAPEPLTAMNCGANAKNLLRTADFESTTAAWTISTQGRHDSIAASNDAADSGPQMATVGEAVCGRALTLVGQAGQSLQLYQDGIALTAGQQYRLHVALDADSWGLMSLYLVQPSNGYEPLGIANATYIVEPTWRRYYVDFTPTGFDGTIEDARLLLLFHPNQADDTGTKHVAYRVDNVTLTPIDFYAADADPNRLYSWRWYDEEVMETHNVTLRVQEGTNVSPVNTYTVTLQDMESGGLLYHETAVTAADGRLAVTDIPLGEYLVTVDPVAGYLTPDPLWIGVAYEMTDEVVISLMKANVTIYLPLIAK